MKGPRVPRHSPRARQTPLGSASALSGSGKKAVLISVILLGDDLEPLAKRIRSRHRRIEVIGPLASVTNAFAEMNQSSHPCVVVAGVTQAHSPRLVQTVKECQAHAKVLLIGECHPEESTETIVA